MTNTISGGIVAALGAAALAIAPLAARAQGPAKAKTLTMTGCLHADGSKFVLTNLEGGAAPKGRNWKTGFVTKTTKNVEVVGATTTVKLKDQVGHKVTVSGTRDSDTHFKAQSVRQLARSCS
ncbi:MAG TPA: hypothetical protein VGY57_14830 [Vicinamibacterales bacterium]|jgi:hypothetical protein|nr:hypothetical protein [Vicinamibacterales bacterium]